MAGQIATGAIGVVLAIPATVAVMKGPEIVSWLLLLAAVAPLSILLKPHWSGWKWVFAALFSAITLTAFAVLKITNTDPEKSDGKRLEFSPLPSSALLEVDSTGTVDRCSVIKGRIKDVPADHLPWLAWQGSGSEWYFKKITQIGDSGDTWKMDLILGSADQGGQAFTLVPLLLPPAMDVYMQSQLKNDPPPQQLHDAYFPVVTKKFAASVVTRGINNCKPNTSRRSS